MCQISVDNIPSYLMLEELIHIVVMRDSILLLQCTWSIQSSALLQGEGCFVTGVSVRCIGPVFKGQDVPDLLLGYPDPLIRKQYALHKSRYKITNTPLNNPEEKICIILTTLFNGPYEKVRLLHKPVPYVEYKIPILRVIHIIPIVSVNVSFIRLIFFQQRVHNKNDKCKRDWRFRSSGEWRSTNCQSDPDVSEKHNVFRAYCPLEKNTINRCGNLNPVLKVSPGKHFQNITDLFSFQSYV
jgi:hypothetical protein